MTEPSKSKLVVLDFVDKDHAFEARDKLLELREERQITLDDAAIAIRKKNGRIKLKQVDSLVSVGVLGGTFWGLLIGLIFLAPGLGAVVGALAGSASGALTDALIDIGVDDEFLKEVGNTIEPGHAALFLLVQDVAGEHVVEDLIPYEPTVVQTTLSAENEQRLRETFAADDLEA